MWYMHIHICVIINKHYLAYIFTHSFMHISIMKMSTQIYTHIVQFHFYVYYFSHFTSYKLKNISRNLHLVIWSSGLSASFSLIFMVFYYYFLCVQTSRISKYTKVVVHILKAGCLCKVCMYMHMSMGKIGRMNVLSLTKKKQLKLFRMWCITAIENQILV